MEPRRSPARSRRSWPSAAPSSSRRQPPSAAPGSPSTLRPPRRAPLLALTGAGEAETTAAVSGDVLTFDASVHQNAGAVVGGDVRNVAADFVGIGFVLGPRPEERRVGK